jgi:hypothetical protein
VSLRDVLQPGTLITHSQVTDIYLLGLAVRKGGKLATFDRRIPSPIIQGGGAALELIAA